MNKNYMGKTESFAKGGSVLGRTKDFLKTPDRFTGTSNGPLKDSSTDENFSKSGGKDEAPAAKGKCLPPVKPQK